MYTDLSEFIRLNKWIIAASIFFIVWKFFLIGILWDDRLIAPEPDDSYEYIARIAAISECHDGLICPYTGVSMYDHSGFAYLSYGLIFGLIGKIFSLSPEKTFYLSFYIGTTILAIVLPFFLSAFTQRRSLVALSVIFLAFYHGTGESHGFFWIVPSFYTVVLFFLIFRLVTSTKQRLSTYAVIIAVSIIYTFMHPISIYLVFLLPLYLYIHFFFSRKYSSLEIKKVLLVLFVVLGSASIQSFYLAHISQLNYYGFSGSMFQARQAISAFTHEETSYYFNYSVTKKDNTSFLKNRIDTLQITYFRYILPHWIMIFPFMFMLWILYFYRKFQLLALYLSTFFFFITATLFHQFGFRSAIILWPVTYITAAFSFHFIYTSLSDRLSGIILSSGKFITIMLFLIFCAINGIFSIGYNLNLNERNNFLLDESFVPYLLERMTASDHIGLSGVLARTPSGSKLFLDKKTSSYLSQPRFIARIGQVAEHKTNMKLSFIRKISLETAYSMGILSHDTKPIEHGMLLPIEGYHLDSRFGDITIFERN